VSPSDTDWPSEQVISLTVPGSSASTGISIFMDSRITSVSPSSTSWPTSHSIFHTVPVIWASTSGMAAARYPAMRRVAVLVTARNEAERLGSTLATLGEAFPGARVVVADDASTDGTARIAEEGGAEVVRAPRRLGKGGAATLGAERLRHAEAIVLCDGDLGASASALPALVEVLERDEGDLALAGFARRVGGGFGVALGASRRAIRSATGIEIGAPLSGQRALRAEVLPAVTPFAPGFGMETGMTIDALRAGFRVVELELDLEHRATGRTVGGFVHRGRQLRDIARVYASRR
jgi:glycosyltransferase involved in cell wall biosynthesis